MIYKWLELVDYSYKYKTIFIVMTFVKTKQCYRKLIIHICLLGGNKLSNKCLPLKLNTIAFKLCKYYLILRKLCATITKIRKYYFKYTIKALPDRRNSLVVDWNSLLIWNIIYDFLKFLISSVNGIINNFLFLRYEKRQHSV